jgi:type IV pilus assembly protein PilW
VYTTPAPLHRYVVRIYFISPCSESVLICPAGSTQLPTLKRMELGAGPAFPATVEVIAEGIEDFQVDYGINTNTTGAYLDGMPNQWTECTPTSSTTYDPACVWQDVVAAKIYLLARNTETSPGYTDQRQYRLGLRDTPNPKPATNDNFKRHLYSGQVRLNNIGMNRECTPTSTDPC